MYHYVRNFDNKYPYFNMMTLDQFLNQLKNFKKIGIASCKDELLKYNNKFVLTFDDGLKDHLQIAEILRKDKLTGIFFIPTLPYRTRKILDVHKTHLITGKIQGKIILNELRNYLNKRNIVNFLNQEEEIKFKNVYRQHKDDEYKKEFKKIMNYYGKVNLREKILNYLMNFFEIKHTAKSFYLSRREIKHLFSLGMQIGSHGESHTLLSRLNYSKQLKEINNSKSFLSNLIKSDINFFCYPYGGIKSYNSNTIKILKRLKFKLAYSVYNKDITKYDLSKKKFELPRYDCNMF